MQKYFYALLLCLFFMPNARAATGDTTVVVAHTLTNLPWNGSYDEWVNIPNTGLSYQKIIMKFTLGCGTPQRSHWDYTVKAEMGKKTGLLDSSIASIDTVAQDTVWSYSDNVSYMELGRLITPYGTYMDVGTQGFNSTWTQPYTYDVTDYASFLKDSVKMRVVYDGWSAAFSARVEFLFIEGPPNRTVESVREMFHTSINYPSSAGFESVAVPQTFTINPAVTSAKVIVHMTGHGNGGEFDPHNFQIKVNGNQIFDHILWKDDCDVNAVAPQGGTWVFHCANWCPGEKVPVFEIDITPYITPGQPVTIDLDMDDFAVGNASYAYILSAHLITYSSQQTNDVAMDEIIALTTTSHTCTGIQFVRIQK